MSSLSYNMARTSCIQWDDDDFFVVLDQHVFKVDFHSASSLKQHPGVGMSLHFSLPNAVCLMEQQQISVL